MPDAFAVTDNVWIPLSDGTRLAARLWLPANAGRPVAAVLEYLPYRKNDAMALHDARNHSYLARHGFACVRVDMRGSGDSDGVMHDEYERQEQDDAVEVIAWIARQPWCSGAVGMMGISWGGFNALQVAARRPPALKAVISACSSDDRYHEDVHFMGGCVVPEWALTWASLMLVFNARPPDPLVSGADWRTKWFERLEAVEPVIHTWLAHQRRDDYWKSGSVGEDLAAIECPVYMVGGWADRYTNGVLNVLANFSGPRKGLIGPWLHGWPHEGVPGPAVGFLQEAVRWFAHWLDGEDDGIMDEPMLAVFEHDGGSPWQGDGDRPGRWLELDDWPGTPEHRRLALSARGLGHDPEPGEPPRTIRSAQVTGLHAGDSTGFLDPPADLPKDQRPDDGLSLCFDSDPLASPVAILGRPIVRLALAADRPAALVAVRLCDVGPAGESSLITRGVLNLAHRDSHELPAPLAPGREYAIELALKAIGYRVPAGHRLRLAISPTYWPWAWPSPEPVTLTVRPEGSELLLPLSAGAERQRPFGEPESGDGLEIDVLERVAPRRVIDWNVGEGRVELTRASDYGGSFRLHVNGWETRYRLKDVYSIVEDQPTSATVRCEHEIVNGRGDWQVRVRGVSELTADARDFHVRTTLDVHENTTIAFSRAWTRRIPRDFT